MNQFEEYDVGNGEGDEFEDFDVTQETESETEIEATIETLGGLSQSESQLKSLLEARDELEQMLMPEAAFEAMSADEDEDEVFGFGNIVGVGIGEQEIGGHPTGQLALKVLVKEKVSPSQIVSEALVPQSLGGILTDVEATGEIYAQMFTARRRPAPGGVSIGNCRVVHAGTLGCLVTRNNQLFILSNNHVMALSNASPLNTGISQPGRLDGGVCPRDIIARLSQFIPINFAAGANNFVDAAIARTSPSLVDRRILRPGGVLERLRPSHLNPALNMRVQKSGRTTQYRRGYIDLINTTVNVTFTGIGVARFVRQFRVRGIGSNFSAPGDSGALVTRFPTNQPVGLLFAGNAAANTTFCNPIGTVLTAFGVQIVY